jgi:hypothetical protein
MKCPDCNGTGYRLYAREVSDGCDTCNAEGVLPEGAIAKDSATTLPDSQTNVSGVLSDNEQPRDQARSTLVEALKGQEGDLETRGVGECCAPKTGSTAASNEVRSDACWYCGEPFDVGTHSLEFGCSSFRVRPARTGCDDCLDARRVLQAERDEAIRLAKQATNALACTARSKYQHREVERLHSAIAKAEGRA